MNSDATKKWIHLIVLCSSAKICDNGLMSILSHGRRGNRLPDLILFLPSRWNSRCMLESARMPRNHKMAFSEERNLWQVYVIKGAFMLNTRLHTFLSSFLLQRGTIRCLLFYASHSLNEESALNVCVPSYSRA